MNKNPNKNLTDEEMFALYNKMVVASIPIADDIMNMLSKKTNKTLENCDSTQILGCITAAMTMIKLTGFHNKEAFLDEVGNLWDALEIEQVPVH